MSLQLYWPLAKQSFHSVTKVIWGLDQQNLLRHSVFHHTAFTDHVALCALSLYVISSHIPSSCLSSISLHDQLKIRLKVKQSCPQNLRLAISLPLCTQAWNSWRVSDFFIEVKHLSNTTWKQWLTIPIMITAAENGVGVMTRCCKQHCSQKCLVPSLKCMEGDWAQTSWLNDKPTGKGTIGRLDLD